MMVELCGSSCCVLRFFWNERPLAGRTVHNDVLTRKTLCELVDASFCRLKVLDRLYPIGISVWLLFENTNRSGICSSAFSMDFLYHSDGCKDIRGLL
jgi:hypothetical protein